MKLKNNYFIITVETLLQRQKLSSLGIIVNYYSHIIILSDYHSSYYLWVYYSLTRVQLYCTRQVTTTTEHRRQVGTVLQRNASNRQQTY